MTKLSRMWGIVGLCSVVCAAAACADVLAIEDARTVDAPPRAAHFSDDGDAGAHAVGERDAESALRDGDADTARRVPETYAFNAVLVGAYADGVFWRSYGGEPSLVSGCIDAQCTGGAWPRLPISVGADALAYGGGDIFIYNAGSGSAMACKRVASSAGFACNDRLGLPPNASSFVALARSVAVRVSPEAWRACDRECTALDVPASAEALVEGAPDEQPLWTVRDGARTTVHACTAGTCAATTRVVRVIEPAPSGARVVVRDGLLGWAVDGTLTTCALPDCTAVSAVHMGYAPSYDFDRSSVYFWDAVHKTIARAARAGGAPPAVLVTGESEVVALRLAPGHVYWSALTDTHAVVLRRLARGE